MPLYAGLLKTPFLDQNGTVSRAWWLALQDLGVADNNELQYLLESAIGTVMEQANATLIEQRRAELMQHSAEVDQLRAEVAGLRQVVLLLTESAQPQPEPGIVREFGTMAEQNAATVAITGGSISSATISGSTVNNTTIGATTATTGRFTTAKFNGSTYNPYVVAFGPGSNVGWTNGTDTGVGPYMSSDGSYWRVITGGSERLKITSGGAGTVTGTMAISGAFGCNGAAAQTAYASGGAVSSTAATNAAPYGYTTAAQADGIVTLLNNIRAALVANGIMS